MRKVRQRSMGNVEFIGELYLQKMVGDEEVPAPHPNTPGPITPKDRHHEQLLCDRVHLKW